MSSSLPATVHHCIRCRGRNLIPTLPANAAPTVEKEPPKRGDPIPEPHDTRPRSCVHCGHRAIPRFAYAEPSTEPTTPPPEPPRGAPVHS